MNSEDNGIRISSFFMALLSPEEGPLRRPRLCGLGIAPSGTRGIVAIVACDYPHVVELSNARIIACRADVKSIFSLTKNSRMAAPQTRSDNRQDQQRKPQRKAAIHRQQANAWRQD